MLLSIWSTTKNSKKYRGRWSLSQLFRRRKKEPSICHMQGHRTHPSDSYLGNAYSCPRPHTPMMCLRTRPEMSKASLSTAAVKGCPGGCRLATDKAAVLRGTTKKTPVLCNEIFTQLRKTSPPTWKQNRIR